MRNRKAVQALVAVVALVALAACSYTKNDNRSTGGGGGSVFGPSVPAPSPSPSASPSPALNSKPVSRVKLTQFFSSCGFTEGDRTTKVGCTLSLTGTPYDSEGKETAPPAGVMPTFTTTSNGVARIVTIWSAGYNADVKADAVGAESFTFCISGLCDTFTLTVRP